MFSQYTPSTSSPGSKLTSPPGRSQPRDMVTAGPAGGRNTPTKRFPKHRKILKIKMLLNEK